VFALLRQPFSESMSARRAYTSSGTRRGLLRFESAWSEAMSKLDIHVVVERFHTFQNPTSEHKLDRLIEYCEVADGHRVLDIGCGKAWVLRRMAASHSIDGVGIDIRDAFLDEARSHIAEAPGRGRITLHRMPAGEYRADPHSFDIAICTGASCAIGTFEQLLEWLRPFVKPGGVLAVGDIYARTVPLPLELAAHFEGGAQRSLADTAALLNTDGLTLIGLIDSSVDDWDRYESLHWQAADAWVQDNPDHAEKRASWLGVRCSSETMSDAVEMPWAGRWSSRACAERRAIAAR